MRLKTDWPLFLTILFMVSFGLVFVFSASAVVGPRRYGGETYVFFVRQAVAAIISFCALMILCKWDYRNLKTERWAFTFFGIVVVLLVIVYFVDQEYHRWIRVGWASLQPSEFAKPALIVFLAYFLTRRKGDINGKHTLLPAAMALAVLATAVVKADLGTGLVLMVTAGAVFFVAGLERRYFKIAGVVSVLIVAIAIVSEPYRLQRCIHYVDADHAILNTIDPSGTIRVYAHRANVSGDVTYQAYQSKLAIGSGGLTGKGLMQGHQKNGFLPEAHTDFIYGIVGEELGLFGAAGLLVGFLVILWRGLRLYWIAADDFGKYLAVGVTVSLVFQAFVNMSVALDLGPTKGIPLPLISFGGSSLLSSMISLGLLLSVSERAHAD